MYFFAMMLLLDSWLNKSSCLITISQFCMGLQSQCKSVCMCVAKVICSKLQQYSNPLEELLN